MKPQNNQIVQSLKRTNKWNVASLITLVGGHVLVVLAALVYMVVIFAASDGSAGVGWAVIGLIVLPFQAINIGYASIFAIAAAVLAGVGLSRFGKNRMGIVLLIVSLLLSLKVFTLIDMFTLHIR